jgi:hypothetical protein
VISSAPLWSVLVVPVVLAGFAAAAVTADAVLAARAAGRPARLAVADPLAGAARLLVGQRRVTAAPDTLLWRLGLVTVPAAGVLAALVIPFGTVAASSMCVGVVWFNAMEVLTWAGLWMAGWGANSAPSLIGGYRFVAQGLAYELPLMFALISVAAGAQSPVAAAGRWGGHGGAAVPRRRRRAGPARLGMVGRQDRRRPRRADLGPPPAAGAAGRPLRRARLGGVAPAVGLPGPGSRSGRSHPLGACP